MFKTFSTALAAFAAVTFAGLSGQASAQSCSSCAPAPSIGVAYPSAPVMAGCGQGGCGHGQGHSSIKEHFHLFKQKLAFKSAINERAAARNDAWPKPFACWDKRDYHAIWAPMLQSGIETQSVLDSHYFTNDNELNRVGIDRIAGIVLNMPTNEKTVYVTRGPNEGINQARIASIRNTISTYYGQVSGVDVRLSDRIPTTMSGPNALQVLEGRSPVLPPAIIPVGTANSVSEAVTQ